MSDDEVIAKLIYFSLFNDLYHHFFYDANELKRKYNFNYPTKTISVYTTYTEALFVYYYFILGETSMTRNKVEGHNNVERSHLFNHYVKVYKPHIYSNHSGGKTKTKNKINSNKKYTKKHSSHLPPFLLKNKNKTKKYYQYV